jgi:hypothetical protein
MLCMLLSSNDGFKIHQIEPAGHHTPGLIDPTTSPLQATQLKQHRQLLIGPTSQSSFYPPRFSTDSNSLKLCSHLRPDCGAVHPRALVRRREGVKNLIEGMRNSKPRCSTHIRTPADNPSLNLESPNAIGSDHQWSYNSSERYKLSGRATSTTRRTRAPQHDENPSTRRPSTHTQHGDNAIRGQYSHGIWLFHDKYPTSITLLFIVVDIQNIPLELN